MSYLKKGVLGSDHQVANEYHSQSAAVHKMSVSKIEGGAKIGGVLWMAE